MNGLGQSILENLERVLVFAAIIAVIFAAAILLEKLYQKKSGEKTPLFTTRKMTMVGMFSAIAVVLMLFEFPLPFAPPFYKLDFSELPILIGTFAFGPFAGVLMELIKIVLNLLLDGTTTAFVGEFANFSVGCSLILPASVIYMFVRSKRGALMACLLGTFVLTVFGTLFNAVYLLPTFAQIYGMPLEAILAMGAEVNPLVAENDILSFVAACVAPLNLIKGASVSLVTLLVYKPLSPLLKGKSKA